MKISSKSGALAWWLNFLLVAALAVVFLYLLNLAWPDIASGELPPTRALPLLAPLAVAVLIVFRALTVDPYEWIIGDTHLRIRVRKQPDVVIAPEDIDSIDREQEPRGGDRDNGLPHVRFVVTLKDGETFASPFMTDDAQISRAWRKLEALMRGRG